MVRIVRFGYNNKKYEVLNDRIPLFEHELYDEEAQDEIFIYDTKALIKYLNRSKAQKERWQKQKEAKALGIPYIPKTKRVTGAYLEQKEPILKKEINFNTGLFKNIKK